MGVQGILMTLLFFKFCWFEKGWSKQVTEKEIRDKWPYAFSLNLIIHVAPLIASMIDVLVVTFCTNFAF